MEQGEEEGEGEESNKESPHSPLAPSPGWVHEGKGIGRGISQRRFVPSHPRRKPPSKGSASEASGGDVALARPATEGAAELGGPRAAAPRGLPWVGPPVDSTQMPSHAECHGSESRQVDSCS